jgi:hypothetical protein
MWRSGRRQTLEARQKPPIGAWVQELRGSKTSVAVYIDGRESEDSGGGNMLFVTRILACCEVGESKLIQDHGVSIFEIGAYRIVTPKKAP